MIEVYVRARDMCRTLDVCEAIKWFKDGERIMAEIRNGNKLAGFRMISEIGITLRFESDPEKVSESKSFGDNTMTIEGGFSA